MDFPILWLSRGVQRPNILVHFGVLMCVLFFWEACLCLVEVNDICVTFMAFLGGGFLINLEVPFPIVDIIMDRYSAILINFYFM